MQLELGISQNVRPIPQILVDIISVNRSSSEHQADLPQPPYFDRPKTHILVLLSFLFHCFSSSSPILPLDLQDRRGNAILFQVEMAGDYEVRLLRETNMRRLKGECLNDMELK